jgi:protein phosphatase PTC6
MFKLITGHRSDTRILLCASHSGTACAMTENHRAEGRIESVRLRRMMGTGVIADSFGDVRCVQSDFRGKREVE